MHIAESYKLILLPAVKKSYLAIKDCSLQTFLHTLVKTIHFGSNFQPYDFKPFISLFKNVKALFFR